MLMYLGKGGGIFVCKLTFFLVSEQCVICVRLAYFQANRLLTELYKQETEIRWRKDDGYIKSKQTSIARVRYHLLPVASFLTPLIFHYPLPLRVWCLLVIWSMGTSLKPFRNDTVGGGGDEEEIFVWKLKVFSFLWAGCDVCAKPVQQLLSKTFFLFC